MTDQRRHLATRSLNLAQITMRGLCTCMRVYFGVRSCSLFLHRTPMETTDDRTTFATEGETSRNDHVDPAKKDQVVPAITTQQEQETPPPGETEDTRGRITTPSGSFSKLDQDEFLTAQATGGAMVSVTPPGHRANRSGSSSDDPYLLVSLARIEVRFQVIDVQLVALT